MLPVFAIASNIATSIGLSTRAVWKSVMDGETGIHRHVDEALSPTPFWASRMDENAWQTIQEKSILYPNLTPFEQMAFFSAQQALEQCAAPLEPDETILIIATTKGNIAGLNDHSDERNLLSKSAQMVARALSITNRPVVVSHACVSGVSALLYGMRLLQNGRYKNAIVTGADQFTRFVLSGFQSFQAIADEPCRPFDANRKGINLGEAAATIVLSTETANPPLARLCSGSTSNDANHISGPSRTGEELAMAIRRALDEATLASSDINAISAHGTATIYNDEMEARAFAHAGLLHAGVHSMKGYVGHTLGAAGILESAMVIESLQQQRSIPSIGFTELGVPAPLNITVNADAATLNYVLKTASGFGGCNAVAIWAKI